MSSGAVGLLLRALLPDGPPGRECSICSRPSRLNVYVYRLQTLKDGRGRTKKTPFPAAPLTLLGRHPIAFTVQWQLNLHGDSLRPGDVLMTNHPTAGNSHLPDITLITPVFEGDKIIFFVASRGHHADIGGILAGSMPPTSTELYQEGAMWCVERGRDDPRSGRVAERRIASP